jgi:hypothetical protein
MSNNKPEILSWEGWFNKRRTKNVNELCMEQTREAFHANKEWIDWAQEIIKERYSEMVRLQNCNLELEKQNKRYRDALTKINNLIFIGLKSCTTNKDLILNEIKAVLKETGGKDE